jgi:signal transduction histidine kinase
MAALRGAVDRYLARGTDGLGPADATALRRLNAWMLLITGLVPLIVVQQLLGPQRRTAAVNTGFWLVALACRAWVHRGGAGRAARGRRAHDVLLVAAVIDLVVTALLNGGIQAAGLWYLLLIPITVAHMRSVRKTILWTAVCIAAVFLVAAVDPIWPFPRDLRVETVNVAVSMRIILLGAVSAFVVAAANVTRQHVAAIEEREERLREKTRELTLARDEADAARLVAEDAAVQLSAAKERADAASRAKSQDIEALRAAERELRATNAELDAFAYSVSHDLRTPLVALQGLAGMIAEDYGARLDDQGRHLLGRLQINVQQMERLIQDLLAFSRIGREAAGAEAVRLDDVVADVAAGMARTLEARGITVLQRDLGTLWGRRTDLERVIGNLLGNAVKYIGDTPAPLIEVGMLDRGPFVECYVKDNGIGIDPQYHDKVFEIFQRLHDVDAEGTGVGLAIVAKIVAGAGGRVWVESARGRGATFRFTWPAGAAEAACGSPRPRGEVPESGRCSAAPPSWRR